MAEATQDFVPIEGVRDGIITLKGGEMRAVLMTSSINLALKSEDEQQAIIMQFQNLLNSLEFPIQVFIQSRRLNIKPYLTTLEKRSTEVKEDLLKIQIKEYIDFIDKFTSQTNIMTKHFFIVVPYYPSGISRAGASGGLTSFFPFGGDKKNPTVTQQENQLFDQGRIQLDERVSTVTQGLARFGVRAARLSTEEVIELFYKIFNPGEEEHPIIPQTNNK